MIHFRSVFLTLLMILLMILLVDNAAVVADAEKKSELELKITEPKLDNSDVEWKAISLGFIHAFPAGDPVCETHFPGR